MPLLTMYNNALYSDLEQFVGHHAIIILRTGHRYTRIGSNIRYGSIGYFPSAQPRQAYAVAPELEILGEAPLGFVIDAHDDKVYVR